MQYIITRVSNSDELYHYGVKGMKWGKRKAKYQRDGSDKTVKKLNKLLDADKKYGPNRTSKQDVKINKMYKKYDKSAARDIKKAVKSGDVKSANSISAGRTFMKMMMDSNYLQRAISDTAIKANVDVGKNFTYNFLRDDTTGGVKITVNDHSETYAYLPEL